MTNLTTSAVAAAPKGRAKLTNDPMNAGRFGHSRAGRRVRDLFKSYLATLGDPSNDGTIALALSAAEQVVIAEAARADYLAGKGILLNDVVRCEGMANRALKRLGLEKPAPRKRKTFTEKMIEADAARKAAEASEAAEAAKAAMVAADSDQRMDGHGAQADGAAA